MYQKGRSRLAIERAEKLIYIKQNGDEKEEADGEEATLAVLCDP